MADDPTPDADVDALLADPGAGDATEAERESDDGV